MSVGGALEGYNYAHSLKRDRGPPTEREARVIDVTRYRRAQHIIVANNGTKKRSKDDQNTRNILPEETRRITTQKDESLS
jgi:hypothetical protein